MRGKKKEREIDRETERQRETEKDRERQRKTERQRQIQNLRGRDKDRNILCVWAYKTMMRQIKVG